MTSQRNPFDRNFSDLRSFERRERYRQAERIAAGQEVAEMSGAIGQRLGTILKRACGPILGAALLLPLPLAREAAAEDDLRLARLEHVHRRPYPPNARYKNPPHRHHHKKHDHPRFRPHRYSGHHHHPYRPRRVSYPYYCNHCHAGFHAEHIFHNHVSYVHHVPFAVIPSILFRHGETFFFFVGDVQVAGGSLDSGAAFEW